jgi:hypothetical protein
MKNTLGKCDEEELADKAILAPRRLPWCVTDEEYEAVMAELAAEACRWS